MQDVHASLISAVRSYAREQLLEFDRACDRGESPCTARIAEFAEMGLLGLRMSEESGGLATPAPVYARIIAELAYAAPSIAVTVSVHNMVAEAIAVFGTSQVQRELPPLLSQAGHLAGLAVSEPNAGSDPGSAVTRAERVAGGWRLHGAKMWVTNGVTGRWFITLARWPRPDVPAGSVKELCMFVLDAEQDGVRRAPIHGKLGIRGSETAEMHLDGAWVPDANLLAQPGEGMKVALTALDGGRIGIAAQALGISQAVLELMVAYAGQREQFGRRIAEFQAIQWMIADSRAEIAAAQVLVDAAAELKEAGRPFTRAAAMAKLYASEAANRIAYRGIQSHGGYGFVHEFRVEQLYRDARITCIYEGTSEIQRHVIARDLLRAG